VRKEGEKERKKLRNEGLGLRHKGD